MGHWYHLSGSCRYGELSPLVVLNDMSRLAEVEEEMEEEEDIADEVSAMSQMRKPRGSNP